MNNVTLNSKGFDSMMKSLKRRTGESYKTILKANTGEILTLAAKKTGKGSEKKIAKSVDATLGKFFKSSSGDKIRKAKDGSLIFRAKGSKAGSWVRVRKNFIMGAVGKKNPAGRTFDSKTVARINKALAEMRKMRASMMKRKKARVASGQKSFLLIMKLLKIPIRSTRNLGKAMKATMPREQEATLSGRLIASKNDAAIIIKSRSQAALNPRAGGIRAFGAAFNGKVKAFETATKDDLKDYAKKFATRNGFSIK